MHSMVPGFLTKDICDGPNLHRSFPHLNSSRLPCHFVSDSSVFFSSLCLFIFPFLSPHLLSPLHSSPLSRSSGVWFVSLCRPVYLPLCPVHSEETKQTCLPHLSPTTFSVSFSDFTGVLLESQIIIISLWYGSPEDRFESCHRSSGYKCPTIIASICLFFGPGHTYKCVHSTSFLLH